ncbi:MAG: preQ(1) synthase [Gammaproteobacteria bacterium]|nr:preQ(1) synthase [Gammaproteobacteria bacterium]
MSKNINLLDTFENPEPGNDYTIRITTPEFTCLCPLTGQPDFAQLMLEYIPDQLCVELKSYKLYMVSFRDTAAFHEAISNQILNALSSLTKPRYMRLSAEWNIRGGIYTQIIVDYRKPGWVAPIAVQLP